MREPPFHDVVVDDARPPIGVGSHPTVRPLMDMVDH